MMSVGQTIVTYGAWQLRRCYTLELDQEPVYDDVSNTDLLYYRFRVKVGGFIHGMQYISGGSGPVWGQLQTPFISNDGVQNIQSASLNHIAMRVNLPPRQTFSMRTGADESGSGGYLALYAEPHPENNPEGITHLDMNNGPKCNYFRVVRVVSDNVFQVEAEFEVCKVECSVDASTLPSSGTDINTAGTAPDKHNGVLSNRWTVSDEIDDNLRTTRRYHGRLRVASANLDPNQFRFYVVPPLEPGMRRERISFSISPDGLNLDYLISDIETMDAAPSPAKRWTVQHTESIDQALSVHSSCDITLSGDRNVNKADLIIIGMNVLIAKLLNGNANAVNSTVLQSLSVTDYIGDERTISISGRVTRVPEETKDANDRVMFSPWFLSNKNIGKPLLVADVYKNHLINLDIEDPNYDGSRSYGGLLPNVTSTGALPGDKPYYQGPIELVGVFLPYLQSPCSDDHKIVKDGAALPDDQNEDPSIEPETEVDAAVDPEWTDGMRSLYPATEQSAMYTHWKMESVYKDKSMKLAMPIAASTLYGESYQTTKIVTLARPQSRRIVRAEAERLGEWPEMPSASQLETIVGSTSGMTQTYLGCKRRFATPFYTAGGQKAYRVGIDYYFALSKPASAADTLSVGRTMWTADGNIVTSAYATNGWS